MSNDSVVTRFAPSPSGELHLGNARTALFNYLLAQRHAGRFLLRVEDTDAGRSQAAHIDALAEDLSWLGMRWDVGPRVAGDSSEWRQSERAAVYEPCYQRLIDAGAAFPCFCSPLELDLARRVQLAAGRPPRYAGTCRGLSEADRTERQARGLRPTLRFRVPPGLSIEFDDLVHGPQRLRSDDIGDFVIRRDNGTATFFFCNAIDDALMGVTHVLRGDDHLGNTPRQLLLLQALNLSAPRYGHVALLTGADGAPLSKRHGATTVRELREAGHAPQAICNLLFRLGHSAADNGLLSMDQMAQAFDTAHLQRASAHLDPAQLRHWQGEWVRGLDPAAAVAWLQPWLPAQLDAAARTRFVGAVLPNVVTAGDVAEWVQVFFTDPLQFEEQAREAVRNAGPEFFRAAAAAIGDPPPELQRLREATGRKGAAFFMPLRAALTGRLHGPELGPLLSAMPVERIRARLSAQEID